MMFARTAVWALALATAAFGLLAACGGGTDATKAQVRLVNASGYEQLDLRVHGDVRQGQVGYANNPNYVEVDPRKADTTITEAGSGTALLSFTPGVSEKRHYAVLAYGAKGTLKQLTLDENSAAPDTNKAMLRVLNAAPDAGALDIYLTDANDDALPAAVAVQTGAAYGSLGSWITVDSRTWRLRVTAANNKADQRLDVPGIVLSSRQITTLVLTSASGGVLVNGILVTQQGSIARADVTHARVRAVAGVAGNAAVRVQVANITLMNGVASPALSSSYTLVPAGAPATAFVGGTPATSPAQEIKAGKDYTLLVHGTPAVPLFAVLPDDNSLPSGGTQARIRLVNGVSGLSKPASLTIDLSPIGAGTEAGRASEYQTLTATADADLAVTSPEFGILFREPDRTLLAGSTYTVFVLGASNAITGQLRKDR